MCPTAPGTRNAASSRRPRPYATPTSELPALASGCARIFRTETQQRKGPSRHSCDGDSRVWPRHVPRRGNDAKRMTYSRCRADAGGHRKVTMADMPSLKTCSTLNYQPRANGNRRLCSSRDKSVADFHTLEGVSSAHILTQHSGRGKCPLASLH